MLYYEIFADHLQQNIYALYVLFGWGVLCMIVGGIQLLRVPRRSYLHFFFLMNGLWGIVTIGIALGSLLYLSSLQTAEFGLSEILYTGFAFEKMVLVNIGLNITYVAIGAILVERGKHHKKHLYRGFGHALWIQGGFLFVFDTLLFLLNYVVNQQYKVFILF